MTTLTYDALDRLSAVRADVLGIDAPTYYTYDAVGNRTRILDAEAHATYFSFDCLDRMVWEQDAIGKTEYYDYDAVGSPVAAHDGCAEHTHLAAALGSSTTDHASSSLLR